VGVVILLHMASKAPKHDINKYKLTHPISLKFLLEICQTPTLNHQKRYIFKNIYPKAKTIFLKLLFQFFFD
jgi:hypothetical protein